MISTTYTQAGESRRSSGMSRRDARGDRMTLDDLYQQHCAAGRAISAHLPRLKALATGCRVAVEFGVKAGASSTALLIGAGSVISYDTVETPSARQLQALAGTRWDYRIQDSREAEPVACDLLFVDSLHTYAQVAAELDRHAASVHRYLVFHDTITFGSVGADGETGRYRWTYRPGMSVPHDALGIRPAIDELMIHDPTWRIIAHYTDSHGLLVLERG